MARRKYHPLMPVIEVAIVLLATCVVYSRSEKSTLEHRRAPATRVQGHGGVRFPDDVEIKSRPAESRIQAPACDGRSFCENVPNYPEDVINEAIRRNAHISNYITNYIMPDIERRVNVLDEVPLCLGNTQVIFPRSAQNVHDNWMYVVNHGNYTQGVQIETCVEEGSGCRMIDSVPEGYTSGCKQKYVYKQLAAVAPDGTVAPSMFPFPASCCCHFSFLGADSLT